MCTSNLLTSSIQRLVSNSTAITLTSAGSPESHPHCSSTPPSPGWASPLDPQTPPVASLLPLHFCPSNTCLLTLLLLQKKTSRISTRRWCASSPELDSRCAGGEEEERCRARDDKKTHREKEEEGLWFLTVWVQSFMRFGHRTSRNKAQGEKRDESRCLRFSVSALRKLCWHTSIMETPTFSSIPSQTVTEDAEHLPLLQPLPFWSWLYNSRPKRVTSRTHQILIAKSRIAGSRLYDMSRCNKTLRPTVPV